MNYSAIFINIARRDCERAQENDYHAELAIYSPVVGVMALEALLNELAYLELRELGNGSESVYDVIDDKTSGFIRVQTILTYLYGRGLDDGRNPANDLKHLIKLATAVCIIACTSRRKIP